MAINTFSTIKTEIQNYLDRTDIASAVDIWIAIVETRLYSELRIRDMETAFSEVIASGVVSLPADFLEWKDLYINSDPIQSLEFKSSDWINKTYPQRSSSSKPHFAALTADTIRFGPYPDSAYTVAGTYYARPAALSVTNESNFISTTYYDVLLYGALVESAGYVGQDERFKLWQPRYNEGLNRLMLANRKEHYPAHVPIRATAS